MLKVIKTSNAPEPVGPYSQAIEVNGFIFCAGQVGIDPKTGNLAEGLESQIRQIMKNIAGVLEAANSDFEHVVKTTIFMTDINDFAIVNTIYGEYFSNHKPARSTVEVSKLPKGKLNTEPLVEIEVVAVNKNHESRITNQEK